jgi:PLP dependent protein
MNPNAYQEIKKILDPSGVQLLAVSKTKSVEEIQALYDLGQRDFGENYVQELVEKQALLPKDIRWHFIGHLQTNKVKWIAPFVYMVQSVDSLKLLQEIDKYAEKNKRTILCLIQIHIAAEDSKFGLSATELDLLTLTINQNRQNDEFRHSLIAGCMGMATLTPDRGLIKKEFAGLRQIYSKIKSGFPHDPVTCLSMGMSSDYLIALEEGTTMIRIGSLLFGNR